jgi:hypothetical protein
MSLLRNFSLLVLILSALAGCSAPFPLFTEAYRKHVGEQDIRSLVLHISSTVEFRSLRELDPVVEDTPFKKSGHRILEISTSTPGRIHAQGEGWLSVDFGQGIILAFARRAGDGVYATAGWGTITIEGERYDIVVGIMSGENVELRIGR